PPVVCESYRRRGSGLGSIYRSINSSSVMAFASCAIAPLRHRLHLKLHQPLAGTAAAPGWAGTAKCFPRNVAARTDGAAVSSPGVTVPSNVPSRAVPFRGMHLAQAPHDHGVAVAAAADGVLALQPLALESQALI